MTDLDKALADITDIRIRLAAGMLFQGFGPTVIAATGALAIAAASAQMRWPDRLAASPDSFLIVWLAVAVIAAALIGVEMVARSRRHHGGLSTAMIVNAIEQFLPAGFAGAAIAAIIYTYAPQNVWMLPGIWQIQVALGIFAAIRSLPRTVVLAAVWYFVAGAAALAVASADRSLSPWMMGLPFGAGQLLLAGALQYAQGDRDGE